MSAIYAITPEKLARLIGTSTCPLLVDVRTDKDFSADPYLLPGTVRRSYADVATWSAGTDGKSVVAICQNGHKLSEGVAAWLRHNGASANVLDGGMDAWAKEKLPRVPASKLPKRDPEGRTVWVTRARPKIDRIACPWLIRRFVDPSAVFLFVTASEVEAVSERFSAVPFDIEGVRWSHRGDLCTFDAMVDEFGLEIDALRHLAMIVRAADTDRLDLSPEAPGLLAASLGLSRMYADDHQQLDAGMLLYDAFYRWCRDATGETHNWSSHKAKPKSTTEGRT